MHTLGLHRLHLYCNYTTLSHTCWISDQKVTVSGNQNHQVIEGFKLTPQTDSVVFCSTCLYALTTSSGDTLYEVQDGVPAATLLPFYGSLSFVLKQVKLDRLISLKWCYNVTTVPLVILYTHTHTYIKCSNPLSYCTFGVMKKYCEVLPLHAVFTTMSNTLLSLAGSIPYTHGEKTALLVTLGHFRHQTHSDLYLSHLHK